MPGTLLEKQSAEHEINEWNCNESDYDESPVEVEKDRLYAIGGTECQEETSGPHYLKVI